MGKRKSHVRLVHKDESFVTSPVGEGESGILMGDYRGQSRQDFTNAPINQYATEGRTQQRKYYKTLFISV